MSYSTIGVLGGTFDPIHQGHLNIAEFLMKAGDFKEIQFVPCFDPPHRKPPQASAEQRLQMLGLAVQDHPQWRVNDIDYQRPGPSYMVDTLKILREQQPLVSWCLVLGMDAFLTLNQWNQWETLLKLANFIVVNRPGYSLPGEGWQPILLAQTQVKNFAELTQHLSGKILLMEMPPSEIHASRIREDLIGLGSIQLPPAVYDYIRRHHLYI